MPLHLQIEEGLTLGAGIRATLEESLQALLVKMNLAEKTVNLLVAGDEEIHRMNLDYREKDKTTDILSFAYGYEEELIGELAISLPVCTTQAKENGWDLQTEFLRLLVHGFSHLMGYDHETEGDEREMLAFECGLLDIIGLNDIYPDQ